jgi:hypothetical protein
LRASIKSVHPTVAPAARGKRSFLGFSVTCEQLPRRRISEKAQERFRDRVRELTIRTRGISLTQLIEELRSYLDGWKTYYTFCEVRSPLKELEGWINRRLRCYLLKQWGVPAIGNWCCAGSAVTLRGTPRKRRTARGG